jgi:hypothetical protein
MGLVAAVTAAMSVWIVLWSLGTKGFDAFMVFLVIVLGAVTVKAVIAALPGTKSPED